MSFESGNIPKETRDYLTAQEAKRKQQKGPLVLILLAILLMIWAVIGITRSSNQKDTTKVEQTQLALKDIPVDKSYDPEAVIAEAKKYMAGKDYAGVLMEVDFLQPKDRAKPEAQKLYTKALNEKSKAERVSYAIEYEKGLLNAGEDATVRATNTENTTLVITYVLVNRPFVYKIQNDAGLNAQWRSLGFRQVNLSDGFNSSWSYKLN